VPAASSRTTPVSLSNSAVLRAVQASAPQREAIAVSDALLNNAAAKGCFPFEGRRDDLMCRNQAGYDECVQAVNRNLIAQCRNANTGEMFPRPQQP
jgi:hypothetical protein